MKLKNLIVESIEDGNFFQTYGGFPAPWEDFSGKGVFEGVFVTIYGAQEYEDSQKPGQIFERDWVPKPGTAVQSDDGGWNITIMEPVVTQRAAEAALTKLLAEKYDLFYNVEVRASGQIKSASNAEFNDLLNKVKSVQAGPEFMASLDKVDDPEVKQQIMRMFERGEHQRN